MLPHLTFIANRKKDGEVVVIIDAGGGTIDAVTYRVASARPLRLAEEVVPPASKETPSLTSSDGANIMEPNVQVAAT